MRSHYDGVPINNCLLADTVLWFKHIQENWNQFFSISSLNHLLHSDSKLSPQSKQTCLPVTVIFVAEKSIVL